jgi:putative membrane protein
MPLDGHSLPHVNASLNALATVLLIAGYWLIKRRRERAHKWTMLACFGVSVAFLTSYLIYHIGVRGGESTKFPSYPPAAIRYSYYFILITHIVLAATVPFLALVTIWTGLVCEHETNLRPRHRRWAWWTFPIWLYVSVTGVIVYLMIYQLYPPP